MDKHRPQYHFLRSANWMNDPNGLIQWQGTYHLFYQCNPDAAVWGNMHWGHATSPDLVHWQNLPFALAPTPDGPDHSGVWSGCAVDWDGKPAVLYTGRDDEEEHVCLAYSEDGLRTLEKYAGNPVLPAPPPGMDLVGFRDPGVWREDGQWWMTLGTGIRGVGGAVLLYSSTDLTGWRYVGPLITGDQKQREPVWAGEMWECPSFFPLGDQHVLMISAMSTQPPYGLYSLYMTGTFRDQRFTLTNTAKMDGGDIYYYAPLAFRDESGRRIAIGWAREARSIDAQVEAGWAGVMTLPRVLELGADGWMRQRPVPEIETLRGEKHSWTDLQIQAGSTSRQPLILEDFSGDVVELDILYELSKMDGESASAFGLMVRRSAEGEEQTEIRCEPQPGRLVVDTLHSSLSEDVEPGHYEIPLDFSRLDALHLRVFLDRSIIEVYANDVAVITARVYPSREDSTGIALFAEGSPAFIKQLDAWQMQSIW